jgi:pimeloyl-ACP methyl ester carboxylesterase
MSNSGNSSASSSWRSRLVSVSSAAGKLAALVGVAAVVLYGSLALLQDKLIYMPRVYSRGYTAQRQRFNRAHAPGMVDIPYHLDAYRQVAYWIPVAPEVPAHEAADAPIWLFFGGNAGLAQDWVGLVHQYRSASDSAPCHFLLVDYPGYGANEGSPAPQSLLRGARAALDALAAARALPPTAVHARTHVVGHSLGCAAALQLAADLWGVENPACSGSRGEDAGACSAINVESSLGGSVGAGGVADNASAPKELHRLILISPFTSLEGMVRTMFGHLPGLSSLLRHPYDNLKSIDRLLASRSSSNLVRTAQRKMHLICSVFIVTHREWSRTSCSFLLVIYQTSNSTSPSFTAIATKSCRSAWGENSPRTRACAWRPVALPAQSRTAKCRSGITTRLCTCSRKISLLQCVRPPVSNRSEKWGGRAAAGEVASVDAIENVKYRKTRSLLHICTFTCAKRDMAVRKKFQVVWLWAHCLGLVEQLRRRAMTGRSAL